MNFSPCFCPLHSFNLTFTLRWYYTVREYPCFNVKKTATNMHIKHIFLLLYVPRRAMHYIVNENKGKV